MVFAVMCNLELPSQEKLPEKFSEDIDVAMFPRSSMLEGAT